MNKITLTMLLSVVVVTVVFGSVNLVKANEFPNILVGKDMALGSSNQNVVVLQGILTELGYLNVPAGVPFGYYGSLTQSAVASYQSRMNVNGSTGYFGPVTKTTMSNDLASHGWLGVLGWNN